MQANTPLAIRPPVLVRMYVAGFLVFWIVVLVWTIILRPRASSITVAVLFLGFAVTLGYRLVSLAVTELPNGDLRVRNNFGSRVLSRTDVEAFSIHRGPTNTVQALLTDDTVYRIDVTLSPKVLGPKPGQAAARGSRALAPRRELAAPQKNVAPSSADRPCLIT